MVGTPFEAHIGRKLNTVWHTRLIALAANEFVKTSFSANDDIHETLSE